MQLPQDFKEFIELMISGSVRYVMIGGFAYNLYRNPRATGDIDFYVACTAENDVNLRRVLEKFGFGSTLPPEPTKLLVEGKVLMLGRSPFRIDILTTIDGVSFEEVESTSREIILDGLPIRIISPEMLIRNKEASKRPKDLADAVELRSWLQSS